MTKDILSKILQLAKMSGVYQISEIHKNQNGHCVVISVDSEPYVLNVASAQYVSIKQAEKEHMAIPHFQGINLN